MSHSGVRKRQSKFNPSLAVASKQASISLYHSHTFVADKKIQMSQSISSLIQIYYVLLSHKQMYFFRGLNIWSLRIFIGNELIYTRNSINSRYFNKVKVLFLFLFPMLQPIDGQKRLILLLIHCVCHFKCLVVPVYPSYCIYVI